MYVFSYLLRFCYCNLIVKHLYFVLISNTLFKAFSDNDFLYCKFDV